MNARAGLSVLQAGTTAGGATDAPFRFDASTRLLTWGDRSVKLTRQHSKFVSILASASPRGVEAETIIRIVWGDYEPDNTAASLRVLAHNARACMADAGMPAVILNLHGMGYIWRGAIELLGDAPLLLQPADAASLKRLLATHPNTALADHVRWSVFGV